MENEDNLKENIQSSPNFSQQEDEIEILKNIIPEKVNILKKEPNFNLSLAIKSTSEEFPLVQFNLNITLNYYYPEKKPDFEIIDKEKILNEKHKKELLDTLNKLCEENIGFPVIYQLYETCQEFSENESKILEDDNKDKKSIDLINMKIIK